MILGKFPNFMTDKLGHDIETNSDTNSTLSMSKVKLR